MPMSFEEVVQKGINRALWFAQEEERAPRRRPARAKVKPRSGTLFAIKNRRLAIREGALRKVQLIITFKKTTTGEVKKYVIAPYSYRYRMLRVGRRKQLMGYDMSAKHIKGFAIRNIRNVVLTNRKFKPKWDVEIT